MFIEQNLINSLAHSSTLLVATVTPFSAVQTSYLPLVFIAVMLDALIAALWYMTGALLANNTVKAGAKSEFYQVVATALIAGIVIATLLASGGIYWRSVAQQTTVLSPSVISQECQNLANQAGNNGAFELPGSLVSANFNNGPGSQQESICYIVTNVSKNALGVPPTELMDYPLAASAVVTASLASQAGDALNDLFVLDAYFSFLQRLSITIGVCLAEPGQSCASFPFFGAPPVPSVPGPQFYYQFYGQPLAGLNIVTKAFDTTTTLIYYSIASFLIQLIFDNIFLFIWPWLLFAGLVMRGIFFLRKTGGLLIAIAIGAILIYPTMFSLEYLATNNSAINGNISGYGFLDQNLIFCGNTGYRYDLNFYQLPSISGIAADCGCWPWAGLTGSEALVVLDTTGPQIWLQALYNKISTYIKSLFTGGSWTSIFTLSYWTTNFAVQNPSAFVGAINLLGLPICGYGDATNQYPAIDTAATSSPNAIAPQTPPSSSSEVIVSPVQYYTNGEGMVFGIVQAYGIIGIASYFLPIMNIIITLAGIIGLSGILGGDINIAGLSRLV